jgi:hypothetical protein
MVKCYKHLMLKILTHFCRYTSEMGDHALADQDAEGRLAGLLRAVRRGRRRVHPGGGLCSVASCLRVHAYRYLRVCIHVSTHVKAKP